MSDRAPLWSPPPELLAASETRALMQELGIDDYQALHRWSVEDIGRFWRTIWDRYAISADGDPEPALAGASMPGAEWFPNVRLSFAEHVFRDRNPDAIAIRHAAEDGTRGEWTFGELTDATRRIRTGLDGLGVGRGDRVVGYLPHVPETIAAFLAVTSLGATWSCCSPDFGTRTVVDRFAQIEPKVLLACDGYRYNGKPYDRRAIVDELRGSLPTLAATVTLGHLDPDAGDWHECFDDAGPLLAFERVPFDHPLWVLYSSGTTGLPKAIVHGHGGVLLELTKFWRLTAEATAADRLLWTTTTGWVMWNVLIGGLLSDASIVLYDGSPAHPDPSALWQALDDTGVTVFGTGAAYIHGCLKAGTAPEAVCDVSRIRAVGSTGSPLSPEGFRWIYEHLEDPWLFSISGGTDIASAFVGGTPVLPVFAGEIQARMLGVDAHAFDEDGKALVDEVGELVITQPMPSMPVGFFNDPGDERYRESYFEMYPGVWRHGDWIKFDEQGSSVIYGRSDSTINRGGIRMGTAEIYAAVLALDVIQDALVVDVPPPDGSGESRMTLFVVLDGAAEVTDELEREVVARVRADCSPRHVPDTMVAVPEIPRTLTGKVCEVPVKKLLMGRDPEGVVARDALANPKAFDWYVDYAARSEPGRPAGSGSNSSPEG